MVLDLLYVDLIGIYNCSNAHLSNSTDGRTTRMVAASFNMACRALFPHGGLPEYEVHASMRGIGKMSSSDTNMSFGNQERILAVLFGLGAVVGFLLTPLGFETRINELRTLAFAVFFVVAGLFIPIAGFILVFLRPKFAGILAVIGASLNFLVPPADQARFFFTVPPPPAVTIGEYFLIFVGIGDMLYGPLVYAKYRTKGRTEPRSMTLERASLFPPRQKG